MSANELAPIIIKKKKVIAGGGHHGGAWKVAYADFVTAMMAFFMLMWLLNATTEKQRKGIADYFSPTIPVARVSGGGQGSFGGDSVFTEETLARNGQGGSQTAPDEEDAAKGDLGKGTEGEEQPSLSEVEDMLTAKSGESMVSEDALRHITTRVTDEGLIVEIFDLEGLPLFQPETAEPTETMVEITQMISTIFDLVTNEVAVNGHTRAYPVVLANNPVWDLSTQRADRIRSMMEESGFRRRKLQRVTGFADRKPSVSNTTSVRNNRIEVILLRHRR